MLAKPCLKVHREYWSLEGKVVVDFSTIGIAQSVKMAEQV